jgi:hypothetical protein
MYFTPGGDFMIIDAKGVNAAIKAVDAVFGMDRKTSFFQ